MNESQHNQPSSSVPGYPYTSEKIQRVVRMARKELREILRDRRTIITLIAMPLLLYPLMSVAFQQFYLASRVGSASDQSFIIATLTSAEERVFKRRIDRGKMAWRAARGLPLD